MNVWIIQMGEPISFLDGDSRPFRTEMLVNRLVERGHSVLHWTSTFDRVRKRFRFRGAREMALGSRLRYRFLNGPTPYGRNVSLGHSQHDRELAEAFVNSAGEEPRPDLIVCSIPPLRLARRASEYAHGHSVPLIVDVRERWPDSFFDSLHFPIRNLFRFIFRSDRRRTKQVLHSASAVVAISDSCLRWALQKADRQRGAWDRVFPLAYEEPPKILFSEDGQRVAYGRRFSIGADDTVLTCLGRVGSSVDFDAFTALAERMADVGRSDIKFVLAGEKPSKGLGRAAKLPNLIITGWLDRIDLQRLLSMTTVGLLPYANDVQGPTIRNKVMDFLAMGVPVISSLGGEFGRLMDRYGFGLQFRAGDMDQLVECVERLLRSKALREKMALGAANAFREHFTANRVYGEFAEYLEKFAENGIGVDGFC
ncbi:MAG: glycosyltransferase [Puniceicoccales bacterium]|nr:glycosyltransferase [Puniceicoccales bacterium]